jgi:hypothetical protein
MTRKLALALGLVIASAAATPAFADDPTIVNEQFVSTATRADVMAELQQFRQSGIDPWADGYNPLLQARSERTRAEVTGEYIRSRDLVDALNGEDSGSVYLARRDGQRQQPTQLAVSPVADWD